LDAHFEHLNFDFVSDFEFRASNFYFLGFAASPEHRLHRTRWLFNFAPHFAQRRLIV